MLLISESKMDESSMGCIATSNLWLNLMERIFGSVEINGERNRSARNCNEGIQKVQGGLAAAIVSQQQAESKLRAPIIP